MTKYEFMQEVQLLMTKLNEPSKEYNIFVFVHNIVTKDGFNFGFGCPGCAAEAIQEEYDNGSFPHQRKSEIH